MPTYNKLVRDKIPQVIASNGKTCRTRILDEAEFLNQLNIKLREETEEYHQASSQAEALEELADMLEVIQSLAVAYGADADKLEAIRAKKAEERGGFGERVFLIDVNDA